VVVFRGGRLPNDPTKRRIRLTSFIDIAAPVNPPKVDWMSKVTSWPMYDNDRYGDCVFAAIGHQVQAFTTYGQGATIVLRSSDILNAYSDVTGFDPHDPNSDQGTIVQDALNYWRSTGVGGHQILAFAQVDHRNRAEVEAAIHVFGNLHVGINFPASAMSQFNMGNDWDVTRSDGGIEGGHAVPVGAYDHDVNHLRLVTWAKDIKMTQAFWDKYVDEAWVVISPEWLDATGHNPEGIDLYGLGEELARLTDEPNPFPRPDVPTPPPPPPPPPVPSPGPSPDPDNDLTADKDLAKAVRPWVTNRHVGANAKAAKAVAAWLKSRNL
jgi:hypothetical protein